LASEAGGAVDVEAETVAAHAAPDPEAPDSPSEPDQARDTLAASVASEPESEVAPAEPIAWDPERYTVEIVEPDWYAEEPKLPDHQALGPSPAPMLDTETEPDVPADSEAVPAPEASPERVSVDATPAGESGEETMLWFGRTPPVASPAPPPGTGADEIDVVGAQRRSGPAPLPGSQELDDALAALDALAPPEARTVTEEPAQDATVGDDDDAWPPAVGTEQTAPPVAEDKPGTPAGAVGSLTSLTRPSATSATRAYRRLRRIFPG
jgi:hypothetical protein